MAHRARKAVLLREQQAWVKVRERGEKKREKEREKENENDRQRQRDRGTIVGLNEGQKGSTEQEQTNPAIAGMWGEEKHPDDTAAYLAR